MGGENRALLAFEMGEITHFGGLPPASGRPEAHLGSLLRVWIEVAERVRGQWIPRRREGARPRAAAQRTVIAHSAAVLELRGVVQLPKQWRVAIYVRDLILTNVACGYRQKTRRADVTCVRNE